MPKYLFKVNYLADGVKGLLKEGGTKRRTVVENGLKLSGGSLEAFYFAFGETDAFIIADFPDEASAAAAALNVTATGVVTTNVTVLLTPEQVDKAAKMTGTYTPPGA